MKKKFSFTDIKDIFSEEGYKIDSSESDYKDTNTYLRYTCNTGHSGVIRVSSFRLGVRCAQCKEQEKKLLNYNGLLVKTRRTEKDRKNDQEILVEQSETNLTKQNREHRLMVRLNDIELEKLKSFAESQDLPVAEALRQLIQRFAV